MTTASGPRLRPNVTLCLIGGVLIASVSAVSLPWISAVASTLLGIFMLAGADVDARTTLLPDIVTIGALLLGLASAPVLDSTEPWQALGAAAARAAGAALILAAIRWVYGQIRNEEGLGLGDVKLAAVGGAWLPLWVMPLWFGLASTAALLAVLLARLQGEVIHRTTRVPFGAFLCPALWLVFFWNALMENNPSA